MLARSLRLQSFVGFSPANRLAVRYLYNTLNRGPSLDISQLPSAKPDAFRKRPTVMEYKQHEYATFYMPSEKEYFYSAFDPVKVFGKMSGSNYSPMVTKQMALDSFLCMGFIILNLVMLCYEMKVLKEDSVAAFAWVHGDTQKVALEDLL